jgi:hypothetical protein
MKLSEFKNHLANLNSLSFVLPNGTFVPKHFHITEAGLVTKHFIDCGGTVRTEKTISFQVWVANDTKHRLEPQKLLGIIAVSEKVLGKEDLEIEIEYQDETIGKYGLDIESDNFILTAKQTDCLAKDNCGVPQKKEKLQLAELTNEKQSCCSPESGCC